MCFLEQVVTISKVFVFYLHHTITPKHIVKTIVQHICTINVDGNFANVEQPTPDAMSSRAVTANYADGPSDDHVYEKLQLNQNSNRIQVAALEGFVNERDNSDGFVQEYDVSVCC